MTKKALELLQAMFGDKSGIQLPIGVAQEVVEIREWIAKELSK